LRLSKRPPKNSAESSNVRNDRGSWSCNLSEFYKTLTYTRMSPKKSHQADIYILKRVIPFLTAKSYANFFIYLHFRPYNSSCIFRHLTISYICLLFKRLLNCPKCVQNTILTFRKRFILHILLKDWNVQIT
jgi:hypothetical protein